MLYFTISTQMVRTRTSEARDLNPLFEERQQSRGRAASHGQAQFGGQANRSALSRDSTRGLSPDPHDEHIGYMGYTLDPSRSSTKY